MNGCDIRKATKITKEILMNPELIRINQDPESRGAYRIQPEPQWFNGNECFILVKVLADGELAIGFFNLSDGQRELSLQFWDLGLPYASNKSLSLYDCWNHKELGTYKERYAPTVPAHDCVIVRAKLV